jgi:hypothetical protein
MAAPVMHAPSVGRSWCRCAREWALFRRYSVIECLETDPLKRFCDLDETGTPILLLSTSAMPLPAMGLLACLLRPIGSRFARRRRARELPAGSSAL